MSGLNLEVSQAKVKEKLVPGRQDISEQHRLINSTVCNTKSVWYWRLESGELP
jgi:hypothetical protein